MRATDTPDERLTLTQFTDPMCTWCWGSEPIIRHIRTAFGEQVRIEYIMGGLIEDFDTFYDATNDISEPSEVGPHWQEASEHHGMPVDTEVFDTDPAQSTYPASIAFTAARQQDRTLAHRYLRRLRAAYATEVRNVNRREEQVELAAEVGLDIDEFIAALEDGTARTAFEDDLARTRRAGVRAFPTYHIDGPNGEETVAGFKSFDELTELLSAAAPSIEQSSPPALREFVAEYGPVATQEIAEVYELSYGQARQALHALEDDDVVSREARGNGFFWQTTAGRES